VPKEGHYDPDKLFWLSLFGSYYAISPLPVVALTLDRCLVISFTFNTTVQARLQKLLLFTALLAIGGVYALVVVTAVIYQLPLGVERLETCLTSTCLMVRTPELQLPLVLKNSGEAVAYAGTVLFFYLMRVVHASYTQNVVSGCGYWSGLTYMYHCST